MKDTLSAKDISSITGINESKIETCIKCGGLSPKHFSSTGTMVENPTNGVRTRQAGRVTGSPEKVAEIKRCRQELQPYQIEVEPISASERFDAFWKSPGGKRRMMSPRWQREIENINSGAPADWKGNAVWAMPEGYSAINWDRK